MKKGQMSIEIGVLLLVAIVCSAVGGYYFSSNVADSGSTAKDSANTVTSALNPENSGTVENLNNILYSENIELYSESSNTQIDYWMEDFNTVWCNADISNNMEIYVTIDRNIFEQNPKNVFIYFDSFDDQTTDFTGTATIDFISDSRGGYALKSTGYGEYTSLLSDESLNAGYIYECKLIIPEDASANIPGIMIHGQSGVNGYQIVIDDRTETSSSQMDFQMRSNYSPGSVIENSLSSLDNQVHSNTEYDLQFITTDTELIGKLYLDDDLMYTLCHTPYTTYHSGKYGIVADGYGIFDNYKVRKYVENEPTYVVEKINSTTLKYTISTQGNIENYSLKLDISNLNLENIQNINIFI